MKKSKTRLFIEKKISQNLMIYIKEKQHHFLKNVLRVKLNDAINVFDGVTGEWRSQVISISKDKTALKVEKKIREFETQPDIWLIFAPIKLFRLNIIIQKAVELGVSKFIPCKTEFSNFDKLNYFSTPDKRKIMRKQIFNLLKKDQELIGNKILDYYNV